MDTTWANSVSSECTTAVQNIRNFVSSGVHICWEALYTRDIYERFVRFIFFIVRGDQKEAA